YESLRVLGMVTSVYVAKQVLAQKHQMATSVLYKKFDYDDWLAAECGCTPSEEWRKQMYFISRKNKKTQPETYRDEWDDDDLIIQAHEDFVKYIPEPAQAQKLSR
ncbi:Flavin-containing monooxygenase FMO GS-OX1, partial [Datura stramonium]|nr:Flavin-containing monooxygenase FMO GS-OX1 [Datura stramonium]